jgi:VanZ family protein
MPSSAASPPAANASAGSLATACLLYALFVVYGSLVPLDYHPRSFESAWSAFQNVPYLRLGVASRADWVANILLYVPLAFLATGAIATSTRSSSATMAGAIVVAAACIALAFAVEFEQLFFPPRTVSQNDLIAETLGTLLGIVLWIAAGPKLVGLWRVVLSGSTESWRALAALYTLAYLAYSLFPFDFLVSASELGAKFAHSERFAFIAAGSCGSALGCSVRLVAEVLLAVPLGALAARAFPQLGVGVALACGLLLGLVIEALQLLLASAVTQGASIVTRGLGVALGVAIQRVFRLAWLTRYAREIRIAMVAGVPVYLGLLAVLNGYAGKLEPLWVAGTKLGEAKFLPFYYHYFTSETAAVTSLLANAGAYALVGFATWLLGPAHDRRWASAAIALAISLAIEILKLFLPGKKPDPTNLLIAFASAWLVNAVLVKLSQARPGVVAQRASPRAPSARRYALAGGLTLAIVAAAGLALAPSGGEEAVDESTLGQLPAGHDLPEPSLPRFKRTHPRLPAPSAADLARLVAENPGYLREIRKRADGGRRDIWASALLERMEPGSIDIDELYRRLVGLQFSWRGHEQGMPLAVAYDWLHDRFSDSQRAELRAKLADGCDYLISVIRKERLSPYNVYLYNSPFQALMACSLALYGDDPRGEPVMRFTYDYWKNRVLPVWRQVMGKNGGWHEGGEYVGIGIGQAIHRLPAMWRSATGEDVFADEPGIRGFLDFLVYRTRPDGTHFRWGDGSFYDRIVPDLLPLALEYGHAAAYGLRPPGRGGPIPTSWPWGPLADPALHDPAALERLPLTKYLDGIGMIVARSDWSPDATYVTFKAGDNYWSHVHLDQGAFTIYKGGELAIDSGLYGPAYGSDHHMNYSYQTIAHNTLTVTDPDDTVPAPRKDEAPRPIANDGGQRRIGSGWGVEAAPLDLDEWNAKREIYHTGTMEQVFEGNGLTVAVADVTPAYSNSLSGKGTFSHRTRRVERFWRTFAYDRVDDVIVVFDQVIATRGSFRKRWLLHSIEEPRTSPQGFEIGLAPQNRPGRAGGQLVGKVLLPKDASINAVGGPGLEFLAGDRNYDENGKLADIVKKLGPNRSEPGAWRIEVSPPRDAREDRFLVVMLPSAFGTTPAHRVRLLESGDRVGCEIAGPNRTTRWWFTPGRNGVQVQVTEGTRTTDHDVLGQAAPPPEPGGWMERAKGWVGLGQ